MNALTDFYPIICTFNNQFILHHLELQAISKGHGMAKEANNFFHC